MSINSQNFALAVAPKIAVTPQVVATAGAVNGVKIALAGQDIEGRELAFVFASDDAVAAKVQYSDDDGSTWADFTGGTLSANANAKAISIGLAKFGHDWVRLVLTTSVNGKAVAAFYTPFQLLVSPPYNYVAGTDYLALSN